jgi:hypothetical protein
MLSMPPTIRIWLSAQPADLRKSFDSLRTPDLGKIFSGRLRRHLLTPTVFR